MTEDQQQGLKQIRERTERLKIGREPVDEGEVDRVYENTISDLLKDIDFLLSIVKGQEASSAAPFCSVHKEIEDRDGLVLEVGNDCVACSLHERTSILNMLEPFASADGSQDSLAVLRRVIDGDSMRSLCVEKVRAMGEQWRQEASKAGRMFSDKTAVATKIAKELESLQLQEQEAKQ